MKKVIITYGLIFILGISYSFSQNTLLIQQQQIDSLKSLISSQKKENEEKVRLLNEYARLNFFNQEYLTGFEATIQARDLSIKINYAVGEILYHQTLATFLYPKEL